MRSFLPSALALSAASALLWALAGCASTPPGIAAPDGGGGTRADGGLRADGGSVPTVDGGAGTADGGAPTLDGGGLSDGGGSGDGGGPGDGGNSAGVGDGGAGCQDVTITPSTRSAGLDCDGTLDPAAIRDQVCAGTRIAAGLYSEATGTRNVEWQVDGDGSGHLILSGRDTLAEAQSLVEAANVVTLTGCTAETDDYFSVEGLQPGLTEPTYYRVNKYAPWPYVLDGPNSVEGRLGQVGPPGVTLSLDSVAHVAQYLWFVERDYRPSVFLLGGRPVAGPPLGHVLCEAEKVANTISVRKVVLTVDGTSRAIWRTVEARSTFAANCP